MEATLLRQQLSEAIDRIQLAVKAAADELPAAQRPLLQEIGRRAGSLAQECLTTPSISHTRREVANESPRVDAHPGDEASLNRGDYREADFNESPEFRKVADLHEASSLADEGIADDAFEKGMYVEDAVSTDDREYIDALKTATGRATGGTSGSGSDTGPYDANVLLEGDAGQVNQPLNEADLAPSPSVSAHISQARVQLQQAWEQFQQQAQAYGGTPDVISDLVNGLGQFFDAHPQFCGQSREMDLQLEALLARTRELLGSIGGTLPTPRTPD